MPFRRWLDEFGSTLDSFHRTTGGSRIGLAWLALAIACVVPFATSLPQTAVVAVATLALVLLYALLERRFRLFLIWVTAGRTRKTEWYYIDRQDDVVPYVCVLTALRTQRVYCAAGALGVLACAMVQIAQATPAARAFPLMCVLSVPVAAALLGKPVPRTSGASVLKPTVFTAASLILLILSVAHQTTLVVGTAQPRFLVATQVALASALGMLSIVQWVSIANAMPVQVLYDRHAVDMWRSHFDYTDPDRFCKEQHSDANESICKKFASHSKELRNALRLRNGATVLRLGDAAQDFYTAILVEPRSTRAPDGKVKLLINDRLVLERPTLSFSRGWNTFSDLLQPPSEPFAPEPTPSPARAATTTLRIECSTTNADVFLQCPHIRRRPTQPRTILLLIADALPCEFVGLYPGSVASTPAMDEFFESGAVYTNAWAQGEWTTSNFAHMFTSLYSSHHRSLHRYDGYKHPLPPDQPTLAESFQEQGWHTYFFSSTQRVTQSKGYDRGFTRMSVFPYRTVMNWDVLYRCLDVMDTAKGENNLLVLHLLDVHGPPVFWSHMVNAHARFRRTNRRDIFRKTHPEEFQNLNRQQAEEFDLALSLLFSYVDHPQRRDSTAVVLTADHGQMRPPSSNDPLAAKDILLGDTMINVPLLVKCPWRPESTGIHTNALVEAGVDLYPTILSMAGLRGKPAPYARSVLPDSDGTCPSKELALTESIYEGVVQRVVRTEDRVYYRKFSWTDPDLHDETQWEVGPGRRYGPPRDLSIGPARNSRLAEIETLRGLIGPGDDPARYYGEPGRW